MSELLRNTLSPWQWGILALVPVAIVALYFLKLKRMPLEVPSTYLWKRSIEDLHVNSFWQRLRRSLLMFLQLLLVALAMLALIRPGWRGTKLEGQRFIFLIDNSASMSAKDVPEAASRLEEAKQAAARLIAQMDSSMTAMIISFADTPRVVQGFTNNRRQLAEQLASIQPTSGGTDLHGALDLARGLSAGGYISSEEEGSDVPTAAPQETTLYIFSDGRFDDIKDFSLGTMKPVYVPVGSLDADNLAITALTLRRSEARSDSQQAFVQVANFTDEPRNVIVELQRDSRFLDAEELQVPAGESAATVFSISGAADGALSARLKPAIEIRDVLPQDDVAFAALGDMAAGRVLVVTPGNIALETVLQTEAARRLAKVQFARPSILQSDSYRREAESGAYDLVIYDQCAPPAMPRANTLFIGRLPLGHEWRRGDATAEGISETGRTVLPQIIDWDRSHPLLANVELGNVDMAESMLLRVPRGGSALAESTAGPIAAIAPRDSYEDVALGFEIVGQDADGAPIVNTNWPRRLSFPTFWLNVLEYLAAGSENDRTASVRPGESVALRSPGNVEELLVVDPADKKARVRRTEQGGFQFHDTSIPGVYQVRQGDQVIDRFAVNLFDRAESDIRLRPSQDASAASITPADIRIGHVDVAASVGQAPARRELWKVLIAAALVVLLVEWYIYNRRVYL